MKMILAGLLGIGLALGAVVFIRDVLPSLVYPDTYQGLPAPIPPPPTN